ncbi:hypothetical protein [Phaeobacter gallaeciensis]|uniref:hypothetical protein n=1 Tax=Phaeobacter gallaeciensis TaxID=60890 RepID=UPI00237F004C|nr:hypothetical protein [Phaeobacter gallaeciensis]MDE4059786.1 hypothetical protein [Phaeobacter gallaeciensis]MDE4122577.1 hypothetical protein [Phaeobacter gallaeciensis]MDE4127274.1 hypothetical protein [Phaeobacter gallaeciensis]
MAGVYNPPAAQIQEVLDRFTPRQIAIAYLRASRARKRAEGVAQSMVAAADAERAVVSGDWAEVVRSLNALKRGISK